MSIIVTVSTVIHRTGDTIINSQIVYDVSLSSLFNSHVWNQMLVYTDSKNYPLETEDPNKKNQTNRRKTRCKRKTLDNTKKI